MTAHWVDVRLASSVADIYRFHKERLFTVFREHGYNHVQNNFCFCLSRMNQYLFRLQYEVCRRAFNENVLGFQRNARVIT